MISEYMARERKADEVVTCEVANFKNESARSLSRKKVDKVLSHSLTGSGSKVKICKDHYKEFKKATKKEKKLDSLGW